MNYTLFELLADIAAAYSTENKMDYFISFCWNEDPNDIHLALLQQKINLLEEVLNDEV